jgi:hypothetical protein
MPTNSKLWQRIAAFDIDSSGDEIPFSVRLARANDWSRDKARGAIEEYKKFLYLLSVTSSRLDPSEVVDRVWQLHLVDTRSYWTDLCEGVLGQPIHHEPIGRARAYHVLDPYAETRSSYEIEFECVPPAEFWPLVSEHCVAAPTLQETDPKSCWIVPESSGLGSILWSVAIALFGVLASRAVLAADDLAGTAGGSALTPVLVLAGAVALAWLIARGLRRTQRNDAGKRSSSGVGGPRGYWGCQG